MKRLATLLATGCLMANTAFAAEIPNMKYQVGNWKGNAYTDDSNGRFLYCNVLVEYSAGEILEFAVYYDGAFSFYLKNPAVPRRDGDVFDVTMMTQTGFPIYAKFEAIDNDYLAATFTDTGNVVAWLANAASLRILGIDDDQAYMLDDVNLALINMLGCAAEQIGLDAQAGNAPATTPSAPSVGNGGGGIKLPPPRKP